MDQDKRDKERIENTIEILIYVKFFHEVEENGILAGKDRGEKEGFLSVFDLGMYLRTECSSENHTRKKKKMKRNLIEYNALCCD